MACKGKTFSSFIPVLGIVGLMTTQGAAADGDIVTLDEFRVVSTATRTARLALELPIRTEVVTPELFTALGARDISQALEFLPGVRVESNCQNCGTTEVKLLGLGAGYNQLLFDGQPLFSGLAAVYGLEHIPTAFVERIEVVKGGASALYGPGAVTGVVNIIPREPLVTGAFVEGQLESVDGNAARSGVVLADWVQGDGKLALTLFSQYRQDEAVDLNGDGFSDLTGKRFRTHGTQLLLHPKEGTHVSANLSHTREWRRGGDRFDLEPHFAQVAEQLEHRWNRGGLVWKERVSDDFEFRLAASGSRIARDSYYGGVGAEPLPGQPGHDPAAYADAVAEASLLYGFTRTTRSFLDSMFTHRLVDHTVTWGVQYQVDRVFDEKRDAFGRSLRTDGTLAGHVGEDPIADGRYRVFGAYAQSEWDPTSDWTLISSVRVDRHSELDSWITSPRLALRHRITPQLALRGSVATGFRAPEIFDEDFHVEILDDPTRTRNSPSLREERSVSWATGMLWIPEIAEGRLQVDVELFRTELRDVFQVPDVVLTDPAGNAYKERINAGKAAIQGFEANVLYRFNSSWSVEGGMTLSDGSHRDPVEIVDGEFMRRFIEAPRWSGVAQVNYTNRELFDLFLGLIYTGPMVAVNQELGEINPRTDSFLTVDASLSRTWSFGGSPRARRLGVTVGVRNLFDARQKDLPTGPERDAGYLYGPRFPRTFFVSTRLTF